MGVSLALKKEGAGLQPGSVRGHFRNCPRQTYGVPARRVLPNQERKVFLIDYEAEQHTSRHLQIYLSM
jgi:hypothetical protein